MIAQGTTDVARRRRRSRMGGFAGTTGRFAPPATGDTVIERMREIRRRRKRREKARKARKKAAMGASAKKPAKR